MVLALWHTQAVARPRLAPPRLARRLAANPDLVDAATVAPRLLVKLVYSTTDNFMHRDVYGDLERCYLRRPAATALARAEEVLRKLRPDLRLLVHDCVRPRSVQREMWKLVQGTREQPYVADPARGSMHNLGCAVDLTLADEKGTALEMGTPFDHAGPLSQPRQERAHVLRGKLTLPRWANRLLLRLVMVQAGFIPLDIEWWHFDCATPDRARRQFRVVE